jgi:SAM-dependent methyltransferase
LGDPEDAGWVGLLDACRGGWFDGAGRELAPGFPLSADDVVVDVGSGDGGLSCFCARTASEVILVDTDQARLERAVARVRAEQGAAARGEVADAAGLPLPDGVASKVVCTEVLEHLDDPAKALAELVRIGRPGALYLISVPGGPQERLQQRLATPDYFAKPHHIHIFEPEGFADLVAQAGLTIERRVDHGFFWTMWWTLFWQTGIPFGGGYGGERHPVLDAWTRTWSLLLDSPDGARVKQALDEFAPRSVALIARKPA